MTLKPDRSPVTNADREVEAALRRHLADHRPEDAVFGEEYGAGGSQDSGCTWLIDPIDGTRGFVRGNSTWATLIALRRGSQTLAGVASLPAIGERYHAGHGGGAWLGDQQLAVSDIDRLDRAVLAYSSVASFERAGLADQLLALGKHCWDALGMGNAIAHLTVARGGAEIGLSGRGRPWDFAPLAIIVTEAGGRFTDRSDRPGGGLAISSNRLLHEVVLRGFPPGDEA